jgi:hypothetical protein
VSNRKINLPAAFQRVGFVCASAVACPGVLPLSARCLRNAQWPSLVIGIGLVLFVLLSGVGADFARAQPPAQGGPPYAWNLERVETAGDTGWYTSIALDALGNPFIAFVDGDNQTVNVAHRSGGVWTSERVDGPGQFNGNTNIAIGTNGTVQVGYYDLRGKAVKYAVRSGSGWRNSVVDSGLPDGFLRLVLDAAGRPVFAYVSYTGSLRLASWNGTAWARETVDNVSILSRYVDVTLDQIGRAHISYYADGVLRVAEQTNGGWTREVADPTTFAGWFSRICIDGAGILHVAYYDSGNGTLRWATKLNGIWTHITLDGSNDSGWDLSLAVDRNGRVQLAYYARDLGALRYAIYSPGGWILETVDEGGVVGWYTGIATDASGLPRISYYDWTNGDLKYAEGRVALQVRTIGIASATTTSATLRGELVALGNHSAAALGFSFRISGTTAWTNASAGQRNVTGFFTVGLSNLTAGSSYELRAEAVSGNETSFGDVLIFLVPARPPQSPDYLLIGAFSAATAGALMGAALYLRLRKKRATRSKPR